ncbi:POU domain, class 6, transcription factor 1 isoform X3 [Lutzomyia longipalpis]|uniref:POU domain, class 6, transcription factor 1 isoform X3 n=1 Tax=Lutzomyia longipalpis TaxID=7200 RepID=UPI002483E3F5|nr:POU domain, class 6, transcription factor 1 isoform X3 [Lutzomyia longipalpis]
MAEGCEEAAENSNSGSGEAIAMLGGTVMPCESSSGPTLGVIKRELESIQANTSNTMTPSSTSSSPTILQQQQHPINLKSEVRCPERKTFFVDDDTFMDFSESERDGESTPPASPQHVPPSHMNERLATGLFSASMLSGERQPASEHAKAAAAAAAVAQAHLNGTMQGMLNLQKLQNLATIQHASMPPSLSGLQGLAAGLSSLNSPLNLSVTGGNAPMTASGGTANAGGSGDGSSGSGAIGSAQLPQLILASGQLVQGIQGAQLLIPTSQGIATQTILTIPVSQQVHSNEQLVQHLAALSNGTTALNGPVTPPILNRHLLSNGVQQLLAAVQPALFGATSPHQTMPQAPVTPVTNVSPRRMPSTSPPLHHRSMHTSPKASPPRGAASSHHPFEKLPTTTATSTSQAPHSPLYTGQPSNGLGCAGGGPQMPPGSTAQSQTSLHHTTTSSSRLSPIPAAMNRLSSQNGELTITKSHGPSPSHSSSGSGSNHPSSQHTVPPMKLSPSSMHLSPTGTDNSNADFLADSPNEPTINQATCNVVDGIDLDEIKEFAKAFKLRRLSLGLTQTQVGQALSVTEGPAYSQSAICRFEKLDITPKSAQKIKPVLERWMKEAEESHWNRYKSGQNHLTDFIGVEPSKKRKRRTSFTPQALELLNAHFERNTHPSGTEITGLAHQLGYEREVIRIWFCNKRQALKNTVRMMSKGIV